MTININDSKYKIFSAAAMKWIAVITMLIDHIGYVCIRSYLNAFGMTLTPEAFTRWNTIYKLCRGIGRIAFPIFAFFLVEGFLHTKDVKKYALRLLIFSICSEIPLNLAAGRSLLYPEYQNVGFTLLMGLLMLMIISRINKSLPAEKLTRKQLYGKQLLLISIIAAFALVAVFIVKCDYTWKGICLIALLYYFRSQRDIQLLAGACASSIGNTASMAFLFLFFYNGQKGKFPKWFFYLFYPLHLLALYGITCLFGA